jgi:hypothetical protein
MVPAEGEELVVAKNCGVHMGADVELAPSAFPHTPTALAASDAASGLCVPSSFSAISACPEIPNIWPGNLQDGESVRTALIAGRTPVCTPSAKDRGAKLNFNPSRRTYC